MSSSKAALLLLLALVAASSASAQAQLPGKRIEVKPAGEYATIDTSPAIRDMDVLAKGSDAEKAAVAARVKARPGDVMPPVFMKLADYLYEKGNPEEAYFWFCLGRMRARYDAARCADATARGGVAILIDGVNREMRRYVTRMKSDDILPFGKRLLKLDAETPYNYDHRWLNLHGMNAFGPGTGQALSVPEKEWPALLKQTRDDLLTSFEEMAKERQEKK